MKRVLFLLVLSCLAVIATPVRAQDPELSEREAMYRRYLEFASYIKGGSIEPHWMADGSSFWYVEGAPANTIIYKVDPKANAKTPLFDTARLRQALTPLLGHEPPYQGLPFEEFNFTDDSETAVRFTVEGKEFFLQLDTYTISRVPALLEEEKRRRVPRVIWEGIPSYRPTVREVLSPDGRWIATVKDHNLWLRSTLFSSSPVRRRGSAAESPYHGRSVQLTIDGVEDFGWGGWYVGEWAWWSPSSYRLAVIKEDYRKVPKFPIVHYLNPREEVDWLPAIDTGPRTELFIVDIVTKRQVRVDTGTRPLQRFYVLGWRPDGSELLFLKPDLEKESLDLMAANPATGSTRIILTEEPAPLLWRESEELFKQIADGTRFLWRSDRDGWNHLYLYDLEGNLIRRLTEGAWPVLRVLAVDEKEGWVYFIAQADVQRPYDTYLYRVDLEGKNFKQLTQAPGQHTPFRRRGIRTPEGIQFPPSREFFLDTHSNVDRPPAVELRRADGTLLQTLSKANVDALISELKWRPPEEFVVKAEDGKTDLYGVLYKPYDFDPNKKYPVIEVIYGGWHTALVPHTFIPWGMVTRAQALAQQGFITFIVDARGTPLTCPRRLYQLEC